MKFKLLVHRLLKRIKPTRIKFSGLGPSRNEFSGQVINFDLFNDRIYFLQLSFHSPKKITKVDVVQKNRTYVQSIQNYQIYSSGNNQVRLNLSWPSDHFATGAAVLRIQFEEEVFEAKLPPVSKSRLDHLSIERQYSLSECLEGRDSEDADVIHASTTLLVSVIIPIYQPDLGQLKSCIDSVLNQTVTFGYEIVLCVDQLSDPVNHFLQSYEHHTAFKFVKNVERLHISANLNSGVELAGGEYCLFLDQDDLLAPNALLEVYRVIERKQPDVIYSDEVKVDHWGHPTRPVFKPDFSRYYLLGCNYINHLLVVKKEVGKSIGWFRIGLEGAQDHDFLLRLSLKTSSFVHIPKILYRWRMSDNSTARAISNKDYALVAGQRAVQDYFLASNQQVIVRQGKTPGEYIWEGESLAQKQMGVVCLLPNPTRTELDRLKSMVDQIAYDNWRLHLIVDEDTVSDRFLADGHLDWVSCHKVPSGSDAISRLIDLLAEDGRDLIGFLDGRSKDVSINWLQSMNTLFQDDKVGAIGSKLVGANDQLLHAGQLVDAEGRVVNNFMSGMPDKHPGYFRKDVVREVSACHGNGLFVRTDLLRSSLKAKMNQSRFDLFEFVCAEVRRRKRLVLYNPASKILVDEREMKFEAFGFRKFPNTTMSKKECDEKGWYQDPYFNSNLSLRSSRPLLRIFDDI